MEDYFEENWTKNDNFEEDCNCGLCFTQYLHWKGDLHDADDSDSDDGSDDDNGGRNAFETGNNIRDTLKDYVWEHL